MKSFPMFLRTTGRRIVIAGGGEQAAQKARLAVKTDAEIILLAPELDAELRGLVAQGHAIAHQGLVTPKTFADSALTFIATGCAGADLALHTLAKAGGATVNVVDRPELCDATTPAIVDRDPVVVAIGTEGTAPVLARMIKTQVETHLPPRLGHLAALAGRLRAAVAQGLPQNTRRAFWSWVFHGAPSRMHHSGAEADAAELLKRAIRDKVVPAGADGGHIALVGAGPGARDLLTLRAVERLQQADVIFYDRLVDPDILELARRDAERVFVGKEVGASAWPQARICALVVAEARKGRRVVRLKSGDPSIFGRATEEIRAARAAQVPIEVVPGVTAATAAAASLTRSLTERGATDTIVFATGTCREGDAAPDWAHHVRPGTTLAIYMGIGAASEIANALVQQGAALSTRVDVVCDASCEDERTIECELRNLQRAVDENAVSGKAVIFVRFEKTSVAMKHRAA